MKIDEAVIDDALELCAEVLRKSDTGIIYIATETGRVSELGQKVNYIYKHFKTPFFLQKEGLLETLAPVDFSNAPKGSYMVVFDLRKAQEWVSKNLDLQPELLKEVWKRNFKFENDTLYLLPFGKCFFSSKTLPVGTKVNKSALLVGLATNAGQEGISANVIRNEFEKRKLPKPDNRTIDAMIFRLNKRLSTQFENAKVSFKNIGKNGSKRIKLSVQPTLKK